MPKVWNKRDGSRPASAVYVGRPTAFGNPFKVGVHGTREEVIARFEEWIESKPGLVARVKTELRGRDLVCWCAPKACHADVLLRIANEE